MPELPEVQTVLNGFTTRTGQRKIIAITGFYPGTLITSSGWKDSALPAAIARSERRGKYMLIHLESGYCLIIHLRMTGKLVYAEQTTEELKHERARIILEDGAIFHFIDPRTFGKIVRCAAGELPNYLPQLGLEPFDQSLTPEHLAPLLARRKMPIKNVLLDQKVIAGLGNIYVCEVLYRAGIDPERPASEISIPELAKIIHHTREVLAEAIAKGGTSISDFRRIDDKTGEFQEFLRVYQQKQCPCGHEVQREKSAGRSTYFCPVCQKRAKRKH